MLFIFIYIFKKYALQLLTIYRCCVAILQYVEIQKLHFVWQHRAKRYIAEDAKYV